jgi:hypothetical protein
LSSRQCREISLCRQTNVNHNLCQLSLCISNASLSFTLIFDNYVASIGPSVPITENRKNCQINLDLAYPGGFQYSILSTTYRGYVHVDAGVTGRQQSTFYFSGRKSIIIQIFTQLLTQNLESGQVVTGTNFKGPRDGDYSITDSLPLTSTVWSPCGAQTALNINSQVRLTSTSSTATGLITDDSADGKIAFVVGVQWQQC